MSGTEWNPQRDESNDLLQCMPFSRGVFTSLYGLYIYIGVCGPTEYGFQPDFGHK